MCSRSFPYVRQGGCYLEDVVEESEEEEPVDSAVEGRDGRGRGRRGSGRARPHFSSSP